MEGNEKVSSDNWNGGVQTKISHDKIKLDKAWPAMPINQQSAKEAFKVVLENAGAILPKRDPVDTRIIEETQGGYATFEGKSYKTGHKVADPNRICGIIDTQDDIGGWPNLVSAPSPKDTDHDGMPDSWEDENKLDKKNPADRNIVSEDGYTMLEKYLNSIM